MDLLFDIAQWLSTEQKAYRSDKSMIDPETFEIITKIIYTEAGRYGKQTMNAVGATIQNRFDLNKLYLGGQDLKIICQLYEGITKYPDPYPTTQQEKVAYQLARETARLVMNHTVTDDTKGATHFSSNNRLFDIYGNEMKLTYKTKGLYFFKEK